MKTGERIKGEDLLGKTLEVCEGGLLKVVEDKWPQCGDKVWYLDQYGRVGWTSWARTEGDLFLAKYNRIFPTGELAQEYAEYLKKKAELSFEPDWGDKEQIKRYFVYDYGCDGWSIFRESNRQLGQQLCFPNGECMIDLIINTGYEKFRYFEFGIPMEGEQK